MRELPERRRPDVGTTFLETGAAPPTTESIDLTPFTSRGSIPEVAQTVSASSAPTASEQAYGPSGSTSLSEVRDPAVKRAAATLIDRPGPDGKRDGFLTKEDLEVAVRRHDPALMRILERTFGAAVVAGIETGADLEKLLKLEARQVAADVGLAGPSLPYAKLFDGPRSEWVVAFGGDTHHAASEMAPPDVSQYRGFKTFLERQGFKAENRQAGIDDRGMAVYAKAIKAPDGHDHILSITVFNSSQFDGAADEFQKTSAERRGYFSLSHAGEGLGLGIGGQYVRPENMLDSPAPALIMAPIACNSYGHFASKIDKYLSQHNIPREKVAYFGTTQEIEMTQADGAMAVLKQTFTGVLGGKNVPTILDDADDSYSPIKSSYDTSSYESDPSRMVSDQETASTPVLKGWVDGQAIELPKKHLYSE